MSGEAIAGLSTLITAIVSAVAAGLVVLMNARSNTKQRETVEKQNEYEKIISRYEKDLQRREAHEEHLDEVVDKLKESNAKLRERLAASRSRYEMVYDYAKRQYEYMLKQGIKPEAPPARDQIPAPEPAGQSTDEISFAVRQLEQESRILKKTRPQPGESQVLDSPLEGGA